MGSVARRQTAADIVRVDEGQKALAVHLGDAVFGVPGQTRKIGEMLAHGCLFGIMRVAAVAHGIVCVEVGIINAAVVRGHGGDHAVRLGAGMGDIIPEVLPQFGDMLFQSLDVAFVRIRRSCSFSASGLPGVVLGQRIQVFAQFAQAFADRIHLPAVLLGEKKGQNQAENKKENAARDHRGLNLADLRLIPVGIEIRSDYGGHPAPGIENGTEGAVKAAPGVLI